MSNEKNLRKFITYTLGLLKEMARDAKKNAERPEKNQDGYYEGVIMGYYSIINLLKHQARVFSIDQKELGLEDINPEIDLLGLHRNPNIGFEDENWSIEVMTEEKMKGYLTDSIVLLKEQANNAKTDADHPEEGFENYNRGSAMAYSQVIFLLRQQAHVFNIDEDEIGLATLTKEDRAQVLFKFLSAIRSIADKNYQKDTWICAEDPEVDDFTERGCDIFDDSNLILEKYSEYGITEEQYALLKKFRDAFEVFAGNNHWPPFFIDTPEWTEIREMAKQILKAFNLERERPYC